MRDQRHWLVGYLAEIVVLVLLATAFVSYRYDLGERWLGWGAADPTSDPASVEPPEGLRLPPTPEVALVATGGDDVAVDPALVASVVRPLVRRKVLGPHFTILVTDLATGRVVHRQGAASVTPASTTKILTSAAALESIGKMARFRTSVRWVPGTRRVVLVGGGDPFLASTRKLGRAAYPLRADVETLARATVRSLRREGIDRVQLAYDDSYFTGPAVNPAWPETYLPEGVVPPITALWVDQGAAPNGSGYLDDPSAGAAQVFGDALRSAGLKVARRVTRTTAPPEATDLASVSSAPVGELVERTLAVSDNQAAEVLLRHVGLAERQEGSFLAGSAAVLDVLARLGVPVAGNRLFDGSGLSRANVLSAASLAAVLRLGTSPEHPDLRQVFTGLPVAGFTGSLQYRFDRGPDEARGRVRAKTGTLTGVHGLAGVAEDLTGGQMAFVVVADRVPVPKTLEARQLIDRIAAALGACTCGVGSQP